MAFSMTSTVRCRAKATNQQRNRWPRVKRSAASLDAIEAAAYSLSSGAIGLHCPNLSFSSLREITMNRRWRFIKVWILLTLLVSANASLLRPICAWQLADSGHNPAVSANPTATARSLEIYAALSADSGIRSDIDSHGQSICERLRFLITACFPANSDNGSPRFAKQPEVCRQADGDRSLLSHKTRWQI